MKKLVRIALCIFLAIAISGCGKDEKKMNDSSQTEEETDNGSIGDMDGLDFDGKAISNELLVQDGITMINVWATFCNPCITEMPDLEKLNQEYAKEGKKFKIIGICGDISEKTMGTQGSLVESGKKIIKETGVTYTNVIPGEKLVKNVLGRVQGYPTTLFTDGSGKILKVYVGGRSEKDWKVIIDDVLQKYGR